LLDEIFARPVSLVLGETGSGKTTQLPQYLTEDPRCKGCVCVTQPRRVAAVTVATRIAQERGEEVGKKSVGYSVRFDEQCASDARIRVVTDGMLLREAMVDPTLSRYSVILLDEAHERSLATDLLLSLLKQLQMQRAAKKRPLRLVVMSATLDPRLFLGFFGLDSSAVLYIEGLNFSLFFLLFFVLIYCDKGRQFPVHLFFTREPVEDVVDAALATVLKIEHEKREGDVLVFLDGQEDIEALKFLLRAEISAKKLPLSVLPLYSALPQREQMKVFSPAKNPGYGEIF
jgi:HrpA-like RNA helicase